MRKFKYDMSCDSIICKHEDFMKDVCQNIMKGYDEKFNKLGFTLDYGLDWSNFLKDIYSSERLPFINGYMCRFSVGVRKNGEIVCYDEEEGATLGAGFGISSVSRFFFHLNVSLHEDTSEIIEEMESLLRIAESL